MNDSTEFEGLLKSEFPDWTEALVRRVSQFREIVLEGNTVQNLTRLTSPFDFIQGHVRDVVELLRSRLIDYPALDLGSGAGVPGVLASLVDPQPWLITEGEKRKAEFLSKLVDELGLKNVTVFGQRAEDVLKTHEAQSVVARAVGPVDRILPWLRGRSTWNNLILLKGPGWEQEWAKFGKSKFRNELKVTNRHSYEIPEGALPVKTRTIVKLQRVPRGTI